MLRLVATAVFILISPVVEEVTYRVDAAQSQLVIEVGRAGLFKLFGHDHRIEASGLSGEATWNAASPETSRFVIEIDASTLTVTDDELSDEDRAQIQSDMETKALALAEHPTIRFESETARVRGRGEGRFDVELDGTLSLRGIDKKLRIPLKVTLDDGRLSASGELEVASNEWGVPQIAAAGGAVKTKERLGISFEIVAVR